MLNGRVSVVSKYADVRDHSHTFRDVFGNEWQCHTEVGMATLPLAVPLMRCDAAGDTREWAWSRAAMSGHASP